MTKFKTMLLAAALTAPAAFLAGGASAQVAGIAVANPEQAVAASKAWTAARGQIQTTYKTQLDQATARRTAIESELRPLVAAYQTKQQAAQQELARLTQPAQRAESYALEQIGAKLNDAVQAAVRARNVQLLLRPDAALFAQPAADITSSITAELDKTVPSVGITPPAGWQPGQQGQQGGAAPATGATPAATAPTTRRPQGR